MPAAQWSRVDFPEPEGPITADIVPEAKATVTPSRAVTACSPVPWRFRTAWSRTGGGVGSVGVKVMGSRQRHGAPPAHWRQGEKKYSTWHYRPPRGWLDTVDGCFLVTSWRLSATGLWDISAPTGPCGR
ncbi:hypothetical protein GCM10022245_22650 [Streptomyces mayteni]